MHADVTPGLIEIAPGETCTLSVRVTNSTTAIDAYGVSLFGLDPAWVTVSPPRLSLFPSEAGDVEITIQLPDTFPAGHRQLSVHVRSENDPASFALTPLGLVALGQPRMSVRVDPVMINGGREANFGLVVTNEGNTTVDAVTTATDPEEKLAFAITPAVVQLPPGHQEVVQANVKGDRPWIGMPKVRVITFAVDSTTRVEAIGTFIQRPRISRWVLSLLGLLTAAAVFAVVLSQTFDSVVDEASVDKNALSAALDDNAQAGQMVPVNPVIVTGKVVLFSDPEAGVPGVVVELFREDDTKTALTTAATGNDGSYTFRTSSGTFKIRFSGAGFTPVWYVNGDTAAAGQTIETEQGSPMPPLETVKVGGRPGTIKGTVEADDLTDIKASLTVPGGITDTPSEVKTVNVSADGTFVFENVPSPASYTLVVQKPGYATETRTVFVDAAQTVDNIEIVLRKGDGAITGTIVDANGPLGGATIEATDGTTTISTVSLTDGAVGTFAVRGLVTPQIYTLTISRDGYKTETRTINVEAGPAAPAGTIVLTSSTGAIHGTVSQVGVGPIGGVTVTVSSGDTTISTVTASTGFTGTYVVGELPVPDTYTITFSRVGLVSQVRVQDLDPSNSSPPPVDVALVSSSAIVEGTIRTSDGRTAVAGATVVLDDGTNKRTLVSTNDPLGGFDFTGVAPGAYTLTAVRTGSNQAAVLVNVVANDHLTLDVRLESQASVTGLVVNRTTQAPIAGVTVRLFAPDQFPNLLPSTPATVTDANGSYSFGPVDAPQNYVVAVYSSSTDPVPLDSQLILTTPSQTTTVATFQVAVS